MRVGHRRAHTLDTTTRSLTAAGASDTVDSSSQLQEHGKLAYPGIRELVLAGVRSHQNVFTQPRLKADICCLAATNNNPAADIPAAIYFDGSNRATRIKNEGQVISLATLQEPHIWQRSQVDGLTMSV